MSARAGFAVTMVAMATLGCAARPATSATPASPPLYTSPPDPPAPTVDDVSRARGFPLGGHVEVETLDHEAFVRALREEEKASDWGAHFADLYLSALSMAGPSSGAGAAAQKSYDESIAGFYALRAKKLYLRRDTNEKAAENALTLAHEEEHALQDRFFGIPDFLKMSNADEMLAAKALFEGDATLTSTVMRFAQGGATNAVSIAAFASLSEGDYARASGPSSTHDGVPALSRAVATWPYQRGATFAALLAVNGGWELLNAALRNPPTTTEQVLHVEKYIAGEGPIDVRPPEPPDGYLGVEHGRLGELQSRYFLAECLTTQRAEAAARGWGGDAFLIATQGPRNALLWSTAWDDERAALRFFEALNARKKCTGGEKPPFVAVRDGVRVAFVQGLDDDETRNREAQKLLGLVGRTPPSLPPVGEVHLVFRPPIPRDFAHQWHIDQGDKTKLIAPLIGLESDLGAMTLLKDDSFELLASDGVARVSVSVRWSPPSDALRSSLLEMFVTALRATYPLDRVFDLGTSLVAVGPSASLEARTVRAGGKRSVRLALLPVCEGRMTLALTTAWPPGSATGEATANAWLKSVHASDSSPACEALKTLRDPSAPRR